MSIRPIDTQVIINSTPDAAKLQSAQNKQDENMQAQSAQIMQKKIEQEREQVNKTENTYKVKKADNQEKEQGKKEQKKKNKDEKIDKIIRFNGPRKIDNSKSCNDSTKSFSSLNERENTLTFQWIKHFLYIPIK